MARPENKAFKYVRAILDTKDRSGSPVLFRIGRVDRGPDALYQYVELIFRGPSSDSSGFNRADLTNAVRTAFSGIKHKDIGNGVPPKVERALTVEEAKEIQRLTECAVSSYPDTFLRRTWEPKLQDWSVWALKYIAKKERHHRKEQSQGARGVPVESFPNERPHGKAQPQNWFEVPNYSSHENWLRNEVVLGIILAAILLAATIGLGTFLNKVWQSIFG